MDTPYWTNRLSTPKDTPAILELVRAVHGDSYQEIDEPYWCWRYLSSTAFRARIMVAEYKDVPIGIQPFAIFDWQRRDLRVKGAMYTGVLTHPLHRRRGVFKSLVEASNEQAASEGALFSMTLPNDASLQGFLKTGEWQYPGLIPLYLKVASGRNMLRSKMGGALASVFGWGTSAVFRPRGDNGAAKFDTFVEDDVPGELDAVADEFARDCDTLMIRRSADYWRWRYLSRPRSTYTTIVGVRNGSVVGAVATARGRRARFDVGMVIDLVARGGLSTMRGLLRAAEEELLARDIGLLACQATTPLMAKALRHEGYRAAGTWITRKKFHFVFRPTGHAVGEPLAQAMADWHLMFGDSDNV